MKEVGKIWMNGKLVPFKNAKVHVLTHALHYSTAIFEGIRCYNTPRGSAIFRLPEHVDRFFNSAKMYSMKMQYNKKQITDAIIKTVKNSTLKECYIRPIAYYGYGEMGLTPTQNKVDVAIACWSWKMGESNYSNAALARVEALNEGYDEAIMLNNQGKIAEGSAENIFVLKNDQIITPPLTAGVLEGITRDSVIQIIKENGGQVIEADLDREDLYVADEVFMTGTAAEVKSVTTIDQATIGNGKPGKVTKALQKSFTDVTMGRDERFLHWLKYI